MNVDGGLRIRGLFCAILFCGLAATGSAAVISIQPPLTTALSGSSFSLTVSITGVADLYDYQFDVSYAPSILTATGVTEDGFLTSGGNATIFLAGSIDSVNGAVTNTADTIEGSVPGVTGSGSLADVGFTAAGLGSSAVTLSNVILQDSTSADIPFTTVGGLVVVTPEPGTVGLVMAGFGVLLAGRRKVVRS